MRHGLPTSCPAGTWAALCRRAAGRRRLSGSQRGRTTVNLLTGPRRWRRTGSKLGLLGVIGAAAAIAIATVGAPPARADLFNPRQDWLRASTGGLFLHWGERSSPGFTSCTA